MRQSVWQGKSDKAPIWFVVYAEQERIKQEKFKEDIFARFDKIEKDVRDLKEDVDNIVKKNNLKR